MQTAFPELEEAPLRHRWSNLTSGTPVNPRNAGEDVSPEALRIRSSNLASRRVLVIEDNSDGRETLRILLELLGHRVEVAEDGLRGVEKALSWRPEIALIDIGLPGLDGYGVARRLRDLLGDSVALVAHTGYGQPGDRLRALEAGFDAHLVKPLDLDALSALLLTLPRTAPCG